MLLKFRDKLLGGAPGTKGKTAKSSKLKKGVLPEGAEAGKKSQQQQKTSWLVYAIVGVIIVPFAFLGVNYYFQDFSDDPVILEVNDYELTLNGFQNLIQQRKQLLEQQMPEQMPPLIDIQNAILREVLRNQVVADELQQYEYTVPNIEVARFIVNAEEFQSDGVFDNDLYVDYLAAVKKTRSAFEDELRARIFPAQIRTAIQGSSFVLDYEQSFYEKLLTEERKIRYVEFLYDDFYVLAEASTPELVIMYQNNSAQYMTEEKVKVEYVDFNVSDYIDQQTAEQDEIDSYYDSNISSYIKPERRTVAHILIDTKRRNALRANELARQLLKQLEQGKDFTELVREYSEDLLTLDQDGLLPPLAEFEIEEEDIADAIFSLSLGEVSNPVASEFGVQIFKLLAIQAEEVEPRGQLKKQIEYEIKYEKAYDDYLQAVTEFETLAYEQDDFSAALASLENIEAQETEFLGRNSNEGIFIYQQLKQAVLDMLANDFDSRQAVEVEPGRTFYVRIAAHQESTLPPLAEIEEQVIEDVRQDKALRTARQSAQEMNNNISDGRFSSFVEAAAEYQRDVLESQFINRFNQELPPALVNDIFEKFKIIDQGWRFNNIVDLPQERKLVLYAVTAYQDGLVDGQLQGLLVQGPEAGSAEQEYEAFLLEVAETADVEFYRERLADES